MARTVVDEPLASATSCDQKANETELRTVPGGPLSYTSQQQNEVSEQAELIVDDTQRALAESQ
eukprot:9478691-Pyramimonas_sp.AAC.1